MTQATELRELASLLSVDSTDATISRRTSVSIADAAEYSSIESSELNPVGTDALYLHNAENSSTNGKVSILMRSTGGGGGATARITLKNHRSGGGSLRFLFRDNDHTGDAKEKFAFTSDGRLGVGLIGLSNVNNPQAPIHVGTDSVVSSDSTVLIEAPIYPSLEFDSQNTNTNNRRWKFSSVYNSYGTFEILRGASAGAAPNVTTMSLTKDGRVAIGPSNVANYVLDVQGDIHTTTSFRADEVRHSIRPTLNLDFANSKQLDSDITFYRESNATYFDKKGILRYATYNEPRFDHNASTGESKGLLIEESVTNLLSNTSFHEADAWGSTNAYLVPNATISPDGTINAVKIVDRESTTAQFHGYYSANVSVNSGNVYSISCFFKKGENTDNVGFRLYAAGAMVCRATFNLDTGSSNLINGSSIDMIDVGNGWYYCTISGTASATGSGQVYIFTNTVYTHISSGGKSIYAWGVQCEAGKCSTSFIPAKAEFKNRSSMATYIDKNGILVRSPKNEPRYSHSWYDNKWVPTGSLIEEQKTNYLTFSQEAQNWNITRATCVPNVTATTSPDGTYTADKLEETSVTGEHAFIKYTSTLGAGVWTLSYYLKKAERDVVGIQMYNSNGLITGSPLVYFNLTTGTVSSTGNAPLDSGISYAGDGWWRVHITCTITSSTTASLWTYTSNSTGYTGHAGTTGSGFYMWGGQLESGFYPSSYIPTRQDATVTRAADDVYINSMSRDADTVRLENILDSDWYNSEGGTIFVEGRTLYNTGQTDESAFIDISVGDGTNTEAIRLYQRESTSTINLINNGGSDVILNTSIHSGNFFHKMAAVFSENDFRLSVDGNSTLSDNVSTPKIDTLNSMGIGGGYTNLIQMNGHIKKVAYYSDKLTNAELEALTEIN